jgi:hypothetical protein
MTEAYTRQTLHDYALDHIYAVAESMGYRIVEINLAREHRTGPDIYVVNPANGKGVIVESELGHNLTSNSYEKWERRGRNYIQQDKAVALIVLTETPRRAWKHSPKSLQKSRSFFVVGGSVFKDVIASLLVKILQ